MVTTIAALTTACSSMPDDPAPPREPTVSTSTPQGIGGRAADDLARRLGIEGSDVTVVSVDEVTWPNASLGCPDPDRVYAPSMVEGHRIVLRAGGRTYDYHSGRGEAPFLCRNPMPPTT